MAGYNKQGIMLINKPQGMTSHDVVDRVRHKLGMQRVGHAGTLDPLAEGLLILLVGRATKLFARFAGFDKEYLGALKLGEVTTTGDSQGQLLKKNDYGLLDQERVREAFSHFEGEIEQVPPMVSALRVGGKRLYELARKGIVVERAPRKIKISTLKILDINIPHVGFYVKCSKGTYIRKLAEDIGQSLGCGAHITKIKRVGIGPFKLEEAIELDAIHESHLRNAAF
ncbi:MAG: tRNA pseudouridine(55) synthase TruB [Candidatus Omnitrophota bacterium]|nr:MAG: tRNA pseudouridine(55) synthase TruB [Candidatus Omnitrophota bacterium]